MADFMRTASDWLYEQMDAHYSETVTIRRGALSNADVTATRGKNRFEIVDEQGQVLEVETVDWLIRASEYTLGGSPVVPAEGDKIEITDGEITYTFQVMTLADEPAWVWADNYHERYRIHSKEIAVT
jgi:hypothetical protein